MHDDETIAQYVYHSNRLDGITIDEPTTRAILSGKIAKGSAVEGEDGREFDVELVLGHRRAFKEMESLAELPDDLDEEVLLSLHKTLMGEVLLSAGEWRECTLRYRGLLIASPPEQIPHRMRWLAKLIKSGLSRARDAHRFSWRVHHEFVTLHPFIEANGRMARLLLNLIRLRKGEELVVIPYEAREEYSRAIIEFQKKKVERHHRKKAAATVAAEDEDEDD